MGKESNWFNRFSNFMDQNIRGVQYGLYFLSGTALLVALRSVRPFVKFVRPIDIPKHFLAQKQTFLGKVLRVECSQFNEHPVLLVDHYPLIPLPWKKNREGLPIEVSSIDVTSNGLSWLQTVLVGKEISFTPLRIDKNKVPSIVYNKVSEEFQESFQYNKRKNIGRQLISTGLATVSVLDLKLENDEFYLNYYKMLLAEEDKAEIKKAGVWIDSEECKFNRIEIIRAMKKHAKEYKRKLNYLPLKQKNMGLE